MALRNGTYQIQFIPEHQDPHDIIVGGVYASSKNGAYEPVGTEPLSPHAHINWRITQLGENSGLHMIAEGIIGRLPLLWIHEISPVHVGPVVLQRPEPDISPKWVIQRDPSGNDVYNIIAPGGMPGASWHVDLDQGHDGTRGDLIVRNVPVYPGAYAPRWKFTWLHNAEA